MFGLVLVGPFVAVAYGFMIWRERARRYERALTMLADGTTDEWARDLAREILEAEYGKRNEKTS